MRQDREIKIGMERDVFANKEIKKDKSVERERKAVRKGKSAINEEDTGKSTYRKKAQVCKAAFSLMRFCV